MRVLVLIILTFTSTLLHAQGEKGYMIFQTDGKVTLQQQGKSYAEAEGMRFSAGDVISVSDGWVSLLDADLKRVTITEDGTVTYGEAVELFRKATASMENKFLVYMWEQMNKHEEEHVAKKGGVVRADETLLFPFDSAIILTDSVCFMFYNPSMAPVELLLRDERHRVLHTVAVQDSVFCEIAVVSLLGEPGTYYWTMRDRQVADPPDRMFILPSEEERSAILRSADEIKAGLRDIPEPARTSLLNEIFRMNGWVM